MKTQVVELEFSDNLPSLLERIEHSETTRVILVDQRSNQFLQEELHLKMIFRAARMAGKDLCIVTEKIQLKMLCNDLGYPVFDDIQQVETIEWLKNDIDTFKPRKTSLPFKKPPEPFTKFQYRKGQKPPVSSFFWFIIALIAILAMVIALIPSARILLTLRTNITRETYPVTVIPGLVNNESISSVKGELREVTVQQVKSIPISTLASIPIGFATGKVTFTNQTDASVVYPEKTVLRTMEENPKRFLTQTEVRLDGLAGAQSTVEIVSEDPGELGNLPEFTKFEVISTQPGIVSVENPEAISGGTNGSAKIASDEDRNSLREQILQIAKESARIKLKSAITADQLLITESIVIKEIISESYFPEFGVSGDVLTLDMQVAFQGTALSKENLDNFLKLILLNTETEGTGKRIHSIEVVDVETTSVNPDGSIDVNIIADISRTGTLDSDLVKELVRWKTLDQAEDILSKLPEIESVKIIASPVWWPLLPFLQFRMGVEQL